MISAPPGPALTNSEAEIAVLGACLLGRDPAETACAALRETDLHDTRHQRILRAVRVVLSRGDTPDLALLGAELLAANALEQAGGASYLAQLAEAVPTAANLRRYLAMVREAAARRRVRAACLQAAERIGDPGAALPELLAQLTEDLDSSGGTARDQRATLPVRIDAALKAWLAAWDAGPPALVHTGIGPLDATLGGGIEAGEFVVLGARPGVGKTALALEWAARVAREGRGVLVVSREMRLRKLLNRMLAQAGRISAMGLRSGRLTAHEYHGLQVGFDALHPLPLWLDDQMETLEQVVALVDRWPYTPTLGLVVVDYLQLLRAPREIKERRLQVEHVSAGLKALAMRRGCPVLALSSLARLEKSAQDRRPVLSDLRESGEIEHDADIVLLLHRQFNEMETELIVAKARDGGVGVVPMTFRAEHVTFSLDREAD